jgi:hypothetical protein
VIPGGYSVRSAVALGVPVRLARRRMDVSRGLLTGALGGLTAVLVGVPLAYWLRGLAGPAQIAANHDTAIYYFMRTISGATAGVAATVALIVALRSRAYAATLGMLAAAVTIGVAALSAPVAVLVGACVASRYRRAARAAPRRWMSTRRSTACSACGRSCPRWPSWSA